MDESIKMCKLKEFETDIPFSNHYEKIFIDNIYINVSRIIIYYNNC